MSSPNNNSPCHPIGAPNGKNPAHHQPSSRGLLSVAALAAKSKGAVAIHLSPTKAKSGLPRAHFVGARNDGLIGNDFHGNDKISFGLSPSTSSGQAESKSVRTVHASTSPPCGYAQHERWWRKVTVALLAILFASYSIAGNPDPYLYQMPDDIVLGQDSAKVTIIEYSSLGCPSCAYFHNDVLPEIEKKYINTGKVKLIFRNYPLYPEDIKAAAVALCADKKDYYTFLRALFVTQKNWAREASNVIETLELIGKLGRIPGAQVKSCLEDKALEDKIIESRQTAQTVMKIKATPTLIINGQIHNGSPSKKRLNELIDSALSGS